MDYYRETYGGYGMATPGYAAPVPYGMSQVNIDGNCGGRPMPPQPTVKIYCRTSIKDEEGYPAFAMVNKATGQAIKHSLGQSHPVRLVPYNPDYLDESVLWTESRDVGNGFRCVRMVNNIYLNFDALNGDKYHGGVRDGTEVVLWKWCEGDNQRWKLQPYY
ncbi:unnamed protein product [Triticum aestivum]|uniref:Uncharacterized protein n=1 Tax=Triticum aestivum TaxID=4565 RepID=A0A7H4LCF5_WHEAT|nr:unnamed protein product [Triticum aestivum]